jgi:hypothetical protein
MEPNKDEESSEQNLRISRGLDQVSHLFLSHVAERAARGRSGNGSELPEHAQENQPLGLLLRASRTVDRERLVSLLHEQPEALKEGLKVIDADLPCETPGNVELLGLDTTSRLVVIDVEDKPNDSLLLRGMAHLDWVVGNTALLRRIYREQLINFSLQPQLFLVAPDFSPLFRFAIRHMRSLQIQCIKYDAVALPAGIGIICEPLSWSD